MEKLHSLGWRYGCSGVCPGDPAAGRRRLQHVPDACGKPRSIGWKINAEGQEYGENPVSDLFGYDGIADDSASDRRDAIV